MTVDLFMKPDCIDAPERGQENRPRNRAEFAKNARSAMTIFV
jgi:endonuclease YncB( thermonuclease family)